MSDVGVLASVVGGMLALLLIVYLFAPRYGP